MSSTVQAVPSKQPDQKDREAQLRAMVPSRLRADLVISKQRFKNEEYFVVKDPLALTYHRFGVEEAYLVSLLDGKKTLASILDIFHKQYPNWELGLHEAATFVNQLGNNGLLNINARRFVEHARRKPQIARNFLTLWSKLAAKFIFFKIPLIDPSPWLGGLTYRLRWIWTKPFVIGMLLFFVWTASWLYLNRSEFANSTVSFFTPQNLFLVWIQLIVIKVFHELGHATTSRNFGAEVHEMGMCVICFTPCGYVDASDAYMMKYKRHKIYTVIAGIFTEFMIAAIAAHVWLYAPPGLIKNLAFNAMLVASVNTVFFNMNPLMKFDGYYVISDLLEIPNLRTKSIAYCSYRVQKALFGLRNRALENVFEDEGNSRVFVLYAIAAFSYMIFIIYSLSQMFARVLTPYGLGQFGLAIGIFVQFSFIGYPIIKVILDAFGAKSQRHTERLEPMRTTIFKRVLPTALVITGILFIPSRYEIESQGMIVYDSSEVVSSTVGGRIEQFAAQTGQYVEKGDLLVTLSNSEVLQAHRNARIQSEIARVEYGSLLANRSFDNQQLVSEYAALLESAETELRRAEEKLSQLELRSPISGYVLTGDLNQMVGRIAKPEFGILRIGTPDKLRLIIPLTEDEVELIEPEAHVNGKWVANNYSFQTQLSLFPERRADKQEYHPAMLAMFGGPAPIEQDPNSNASSIGLFLAEASIDKPDAVPFTQEGMRIRVKIDGKKATIGQKLWRSIVSLWDSRLKTFSGGPRTPGF